MIVLRNQWIAVCIFIPIVFNSIFCRADDEVKSVREISLYKLGLTQFNAGTDGFVFSVFVADDSGWSLDEVAKTIRQATAIYSNQCNFKIAVLNIQQGTVASRLQNFNEARQAQLLLALKPKRPMVFFIGRSQDRDIAYAYLENTASPSQGTIWITRRAEEQCRGPLLAHEIGHIALNFPSHQIDQGNLMSYSCTSSNIENSASNTILAQNQCQTLHKRYPQL